MTTATLLIPCPNQRGIVAKVADFIYRHNGNIIHADQHIEQDLVRVSHRDEVADLIRKGKDLERIVLARAVRLHLQHRVLVYGNRTVVFS